MTFLAPAEQAFLQAVSKLDYCNPFLPERIEYEREALGPDFREAEPIWSMQVSDPDRPRANLVTITERIEALVRRLRDELGGGAAPAERALELYEDAVLFLLYRRYEDPLRAAIVEEITHTPRQGRLDFYANFLQDWQHYFHIPGVAWRTRYKAPHLFACFFQLRRAFHLIIRYIIGRSMPAARLRAAVWQSIFTHDMRRYRDTLYERLGDVTTLITGPSGTGKELVARAIGLSRYIPFDVKKKSFAGDFAVCFHALNLSALPATLIESELFGHRRGAFTGALQDRRGWLEVCEPWGTVFLDEVGDLDASVQVKLLRVLQARTFQSIGDTTDKHFRGKVIAATNRDLGQAMKRGDVREDFYYRLCSDVIMTPSLQEQVRESPQELRELILFIARGVAGAEPESLADDVEAWITKHLGYDYAWPGNIRELEQCVRSVLVRREYRPAPVRTPWEDLAGALASGTLTAEALLRRYCTLVYAQTESYGETARRLQLDRRTVKSRIDWDLLA
ncbi:MAG: sigma 54-interacting transcriptional regulator, partial [Acidiferrobacterales bacterium]